jgi:cysteine desulfurase / selenocysteine lyase
VKTKPGPRARRGQGSELKGTVRWASCERRPSAASVRGFLASLRLLLANSPDEYQAHIMNLNDALIEGLEPRAWTVVSRRTPAERSSIVSATKAGIDLSALQARLNAKQIACSLRDDRLRLSPHLYNTSEDLEYLFKSLDQPEPK